MIGAGTVINPIIKILTTVAILAAVYFFIVKPTLDTTESAFESFGGAFDTLPENIQDDIDSAFDSVNGIDTDRLQRCIDKATEGPNPAQGAERCVNRFGS
jgi:hypothetical protein